MWSRLRTQASTFSYLDPNSILLFVLKSGGHPLTSVPKPRLLTLLLLPGSLPPPSWEVTAGPILPSAAVPAEWEILEDSDPMTENIMMRARRCLGRTKASPLVFNTAVPKAETP